jgi:hypothetical protein
VVVVDTEVVVDVTVVVVLETLVVVELTVVVVVEIVVVVLVIEVVVLVTVVVEVDTEVVVCTRSRKWKNTRMEGEMLYVQVRSCYAEQFIQTERDCVRNQDTYGCNRCCG